MELKEIKKGEYGKGLLIENDGYVSMKDTKHNRRITEDYLSGQEQGEWHVPNPFIVDAVFQKYGIQNANGRIYPESVLKRQVAEYQKKIEEHYAYGECYRPEAMVLTEKGWKELKDVKKGEKVQARTMVEEALQQIAKIEADQKTLALLDETVDDEILMTSEVADAKRFLTDKANKLRNAIGIYITCDAKLFDVENTAFLKEIHGELSQFGVSFVDSVNQADWAINIQAKAREYNKVELGGATNYFVYVDAQMTIDKIANGKRVYEDAISEKAGHTFNYEQAARDAYKHLVPRIGAIIKEQIER